MGKVVLFRGKDRCWRCGLNKGVYLLEEGKRTIGLCCGCGEPEHTRALAFDPSITSKFFIPIGNGEHRRFSEVTYDDIQRCQKYLTDLAKKDAEEAKITRELLDEAARLGCGRDQPVLPFLESMAERGLISAEDRRCLKYVVDHWQNELFPIASK